MDLNDYWQENKRFLMSLAGGVVVFFIGEVVIGSVFGDELRAERRTVSSATRKLGSESMYGRADLALARKENEELRQAVVALRSAVAFEARPGFRVDPQRGSASSQYFASVSRTREELITLAGRNGLRLPDAVGLPALSPTRDEDIARHLEALDVIDRVVRACVEVGVHRIDRIEIKLDPSLESRDGVGSLERTRVELALSGHPTPLARLVLASQSGADGERVLIDTLEFLPSKRKADEARLEITLLVARLHGSAATIEADEVEG